MDETTKELNNRIEPANSPPEAIIALIDELNERAWEIRRGNIVESLKTSRRSRELAESHSYLRGIAYSRLTSGFCYSSMGNYKAALTEEKEALLLFEKLGDDKGRARSLNFAGSIYLEEGEFTRSIECYSESRRLFEELGDRLGISNSISNLGNIYYYLGDYAKALSHYEKALRLQEENGYRKELGYSIANIGAIYHQIEQHEDSIEYTSRALQMFREDGDVKGQSLCLLNLGEFYRVTGELDKSVALQLEALEITRRYSYKFYESAAFVNLGRSYFDAGEYEKAEDSFTNGLRVASEIAHKRCESESLTGLGEVFCELAEYNKAVDLLSQALQIAEDGKFGELIYKAHLALSHAYERQGNFAPALKHFKEFFNSRQKVFGSVAVKNTGKSARFNDEDELKQKLLRLLGNLQSEGDAGSATPLHSSLSNQYLDKLTVKNKGRIFFLKTEEIAWIKAAGDYASLYTRDKSYLIRERMGELERKLDPAKFLRIHRSTIVNIDFIKEISPLFKGESLIIMTNGKEFKVGRNYQLNLQKLLRRYS